MKDQLATSIALLQEAIGEVGRKRFALLGAALFPVIGILLASSLTAELSSSPIVQALLTMAALPLYVVFATSCHRIVLLGESSLANRWGMFWTERETRFLGWFVGLCCLYIALSLPIYFIFYWVFAGWASPWIATNAIYLVAAYFDGRFGLVLPATAIDKRSTFKKSWAMSRGKGMIIAVALAIPALITYQIEYILYATINVDFYPIVDLIWSILTFPVFAVEIAIISLAYDKLANQDVG